MLCATAEYDEICQHMGPLAAGEACTLYSVQCILSLTRFIEFPCWRSQKYPQLWLCPFLFPCLFLGSNVQEDCSGVKDLLGVLTEYRTVEDSFWQHMI